MRGTWKTHIPSVVSHEPILRGQDRIIGLGFPALLEEPVEVGWGGAAGAEVDVWGYVEVGGYEAEDYVSATTEVDLVGSGG